MLRPIYSCSRIRNEKYNLSHLAQNITNFAQLWYLLVLNNTRTFTATAITTISRGFKFLAVAQSNHRKNDKSLHCKKKSTKQNLSYIGNVVNRRVRLKAKTCQIG